MLLELNVKECQIISSLTRLDDFGFYLIVASHIVFYDSCFKALLKDILKSRSKNTERLMVLLLLTDKPLIRSIFFSPK